MTTTVMILMKKALLGREHNCRRIESHNVCSSKWISTLLLFLARLMRVMHNHADLMCQMLDFSFHVIFFVATRILNIPIMSVSSPSTDANWALPEQAPSHTAKSDELISCCPHIVCALNVDCERNRPSSGTSICNVLGTWLYLMN